MTPAEKLSAFAAALAPESIPSDVVASVRLRVLDIVGLALAASTCDLAAPLRQIVANAGEEPSVVLDRVVAGKNGHGFNALTGEYGDMVKMGVLDPCKVTRTALQNAASIAGLVLTTDCMIAQLPERDRDGGAPGGNLEM